jgi:Sugar-transfer associated ATP-grasp
MKTSDRLTQIFGKAWKWFLGQAEYWVYDLVGMPMALRHIAQSKTATPTNAEFLHRYYSQSFWQWPFGPLRALLTLIIWPFALVIGIIVFTMWNGKVIAARHGISISEQIMMQINAAWRHSIAPFWFYMFELYLPQRNALAAEYLLAHETIGPAFTDLQPPMATDNMPDKVWFAAHCLKQHVRAVPVFLYLSAGKIMPALSSTTDLPDCDLFVKPRQGNGGHNAERWDFIGDSTYRNSAGLNLSREKLLALLLAQSLKDDFIIQPRLINHPSLADISNDALSTVRVFTIRNEQGQPEVTNVAFRMAVGNNSVVDNFHQGGLAAAVNMVTGEIEQASDIGLKPAMGWRDIHPVSGVQFKGRVLPDWQGVLELSRKAHDVFPGRIMVGWDVAMLPDGPMIIEGNGKPDLDIHQRVERAPLGNRRIAELIVFNLRAHAQHRAD